MILKARKLLEVSLDMLLELYQCGFLPKELTVTVDCTLNELYNGCSKEIEYSRIELNKDGRTTRNIKEKKTIEIKPGYNNTTTICFKE